MRFRQNQQGMALLGVLALAASLSALAAVLISLYERLQHENSVLHVHAETNALARYVKNVLVQPDLCKAAFTNRDGSTVNWSNYLQGQTLTGGKTADFLANRRFFQTVPQIWVASTTGGHAAAAIGQVFSPGGTPTPGSNLGAFRLIDMYLRRSYQEIDQYSRADGTIIDPADGNTYPTVTAKLVMQFYYCSGGDNFCNQQAPISQRVLADNSNFRTLDVTVAIDPNSGNIHSCYQPSLAQAINMVCGNGVNVYPTFNQECQGPINPACSKTWTIAGYDDFGKPQCACHVTCQAYAKGPAGMSGYNSGSPGTDGMAPLMTVATTASTNLTMVPTPSGSSAPSPGQFQLNPTNPPPNPSVDTNENYLATQGDYSGVITAPTPCTNSTCIRAGANTAEPAAQ